MTVTTSPDPMFAAAARYRSALADIPEILELAADACHAPMAALKIADSATAHFAVTLGIPQAASVPTSLSLCDMVSAADDTMVPSYAALRRHQALQRIGWRQADIEAAALEHGGAHAWCNMILAGERISASRHRAMRAAYDHLQLLKGPSRRTATLSERRGFAPPLAWDDIDDPAAEVIDGSVEQGVDDIAVERAIAGFEIDLTDAERREVAHRMTKRGHGATEIGALRGVDRRTINRWRHERRQNANLKEAS